jgi:SAM-dependent methyltransferase
MDRRWFAAVAALALSTGLTSAADAKTRAACEKEYTPQRAQEGKDVIWAPTEDAMVLRMLQMANVTPADKVYDLGSGDGKIPIAAAKYFGATAVGIEYDAALVKHSQCLVAAERLKKRVQMVQGDIFEADFSDATVVTLYLLPALNLRLRATLLGMKPGTRVLSYSFTMGDWNPDAHIDTDEGSAYLWVVPSDAGGRWTFRAANDADTFEVALEQTFQALAGESAGERVRGRLEGERIELAFVRGGEETRVTGTVDGDRIVGAVAAAGRTTEYVGIRE